MNWRSIFIIACLSMQTAIPQENTLQKKYDQITSNLKLIKKCYLSKSICSVQEKEKAWTALKTSGATIGGLIITLFSIKWLRGRYHGMQQEMSRSKRGNVKPVSEISLPTAAAETPEDFVRKTFFPRYQSVVNIEVNNDILKITYKGYGMSSDIGAILRSVNAVYPNITKLEEYSVSKKYLLNAIKMPEKESQSQASKQPLYSGSPDLLSKISITRSIPSLQKYVVDRFRIDPTSTVFTVEFVGGKQGIFVVRPLEEIPQNIQQLFNEMHIRYPQYKYLFIGPDEVQYKIFTAEKF